MEKQVILSFLNSPGVVGLGLMDGYSRPYFSGIDASLNSQQREALSQGIQQVVGTTPKSFRAFEFRFASQNVHIHKLDNDIILLVVTDEAMDRASYQKALAQLTETVESHPDSVVSTFRLLAISTPATVSADHSEAQPDAPNPTAPAIAQHPDEASYQWQHGTAAMNALTDATAKFLGKIVVVNTWQSTRPNGEALNHLQLDRSGHFSLTDGTVGRESISPEGRELLHTWVKDFARRCSLTIRDYPKRVLHQALDDSQKDLLRITIPS